MSDNVYEDANARDKVARVLSSMAHDPLRNYIIPGLTSHLIGGANREMDRGTVRMFAIDRTHEEAVVPHSHRFDFACHVVAGVVENTLWSAHPYSEGECWNRYGEPYRRTVVEYGGEPGKYTVKSRDLRGFTRRKTVYGVGSWYAMNAEEIHSIRFGPGARVLFFEGPKQTDSALYLEPVVEGVAVPTFKVEDWMFLDDAAWEARKAAEAANDSRTSTDRPKDGAT